MWSYGGALALAVQASQFDLEGGHLLGLGFGLSLGRGLGPFAGVGTCVSGGRRGQRHTLFRLATRFRKTLVKF